MPRYFFDVHDGEGTFTDEVGVELSDIDSAEREARKALGDMVRDAIRDAGGATMSVLIRDGADGPVLLTVTLTKQGPEDL